MADTMNFMLITNKVDIARHAVDCGVKRIFLDLEVLGKYERQGHLDTVISDHSLEDIRYMRDALKEAELLVRINPLNSSSRTEINKAIEYGADIIMLPMFTSESDINQIGEMINGRARFIPLIETKLAAENIEYYVNSPYVSEFYIGLNDLHRDIGLKFMFELLCNSYVESLVEIIKRANKPFGFGGISRIGHGDLPAELILSEHVRLGSSSVILSREFHQRAESLSELSSKIDLGFEVNRLLSKIEEMSRRSLFEEERDFDKLNMHVKRIVGSTK